VIVFLLLIVVLLIGLTAAAVMGKIGGFMADPTSTQAFSGVPGSSGGSGEPAGTLSADGLVNLQFDQALRGYRMDQVDEVIDALSARLRELETEVSSRTIMNASSSAAGDSPDVGSDPPKQ